MAREQTIVVRLVASPKSLSRFDQAIAVGTLLSTVMLSGASIALAVIGLRATRDFNKWQIDAAQSSGNATHKQSCIQMGFAALGALRSNDSANVDRVASTVVGADPDCAKLGVDLRTFVLGLAMTAAKADQARIARAPKGKPAPATSAPSEKTIKRLVDRFYLGEPQFDGFDLRGLGPKVVKIPQDRIDDAIRQSSDNLVVPEPSVTSTTSLTWSSPFGPITIEIGKTSGLTPPNGKAPEGSKPLDGASTPETVGGVKMN